MRKITTVLLATLVCMSATAATNQEKLTQLETYQSKELKSLRSKGGDLGKAATDLDIEISNAAKFCGGSHQQVKSCGVLLDKALGKKDGLQKILAANKEVDMQNVTGGAAAAKAGAGKEQPKWQKGHTSSAPQNTSNSVGVPKFKGKQSPVMGRKPAAKTDQ